MFFRKVVTRRQGREYAYLKLIENYREGGKIKQRVIANLGNIDHLSPEKIQALIAGLSKICETAATTEGGPRRARVQEAVEPARRAWQHLRLSEVINQHVSHRRHLAELVEAMVLHLVLHPNETRPIDRCCPGMVPALRGRDVPGIEFYHAILALHELSDRIEKHLLDLLYNTQPAEMLFLKLINGEFVGNECGITTTGTTYQVRPYRKSLEMAVIVHPRGLPAGLRVFQKGSLSGEVVATLVEELKQRYGLSCIVIDHRNGLEEAPAYPYITTLPPARFDEIPLGNAEVWRDESAFRFGETLWARDIKQPQARYLVCYDLSPEAPSDQAIEERIAHALAELERLKTAVKNRSLKREKTILKKTAAVLAKYNCEQYLTCTYNREKNTLQVRRREEVIKRDKALGRTEVLKTNLATLPAPEIVGAHRRCQELKQRLAIVADCTRIPVIYPYADHQHGPAFISGQAFIYLLSYLVEKISPERVDARAR